MALWTSWTRTVSHGRGLMSLSSRNCDCDKSLGILPICVCSVLLPFSSKSMFHIHMNIPPKRNSSLETFIFSFNLNTSILLLEVLFNRPKSNVSTRNHLTSLIQPLYRMTETVFQILYLIEVRMARLVYFRDGSNFSFEWLFSFNPTWSVSAQTLGTYGSLYFSFFVWSG